MWKRITRSAPGCSRSASSERPRLERERLGELGAEEDRALEAELLERVLQERCRGQV